MYLIVGNTTMKPLFLTSFVCLLVGCSTYAVQRYSTYNNNQFLLTRYADSKPVAFGLYYNSSDFNTYCSLNGNMVAGNGESYAEYIRSAFTKEFMMANLYSLSAHTLLSIKVNDVSLSSFSGTWTISLSIISSNGKSITANNSFSYNTAYNANARCFNAAFNFPYAVQGVIENVLLNPDFALLIK